MGCLECGSNDLLYKVAYHRPDEDGVWQANVCADCLYKFNQSYPLLEVLSEPRG